MILDCIDSLGKATVFSALDDNIEYWQVEIENYDGSKTVFKSHHDHYHFYTYAIWFKERNRKVLKDNGRYP